MFHFLHRLFNPHCPECRIEKACQNCDVLKQLLEAEKFEKKQLLDRILHVPAIEVNEEKEVTIPVNPRTITSLKIRREMLEHEDRVRAQKLRDKERELAIGNDLSMPNMAKSTAELENDLLGKENAS